MNILVVDDDLLYRELIGKALNKEGHKATLVENGVEAIRKIKEENFDLMITDILMPEKEGIEIIQEVRETHPDLKIIAISSGGRVGYSSFLRIAEAFGADQSLEKPFNPAQLIEKITQLSATGS